MASFQLDEMRKQRVSLSQLVPVRKLRKRVLSLSHLVLKVVSLKKQGVSAVHGGGASGAMLGNKAWCRLRR
jgi:hypothetical protein